MTNLNIRELLLTVVRRPNFGWRTFIMFISISLAVSVYTFIVDFYDPDSNILLSINIFPKKHEFFSGSPGGFYISVGNEIRNELGKNSHSINLINHTSAGGYENAINVLVTPKSFGLVQEETIKGSDFIREHVNYVTPLYMERMHILYRVDKLGMFSEKSKNLDIKISSQLNKDTRKFFLNSKISTGPVGSSGRIIASYILDYVNNELKVIDKEENQSKTVAYTTKQGLSELVKKDGDIDLVFLIAGAPVNSVREALQDENIRLMSIEPSVVASLNKDYDLNFRMSDFKKKYTDVDGDKNKDISTLGSYAFLIASKDVKSSDIMELIGALHDIKGDIKRKILFPDNANEQFQLDEFDFFKSFKAENSRTFYSIVKDILLFIVSVTATTALVVTFLVWTISGIKQNYYFQQIYISVDNHIPRPLGLDDNKGHFPVPITKANLTEEVTGLIRGIDRLMIITKNLHRDYQTGGITDTHYIFLISNLTLAKEELILGLYRRLKMFFERGNQLPYNELQNYYAAGFIDNEQYIDLKKVMLDSNANK